MTTEEFEKGRLLGEEALVNMEINRARRAMNERTKNRWRNGADTLHPAGAVPYPREGTDEAVEAAKKEARERLENNWKTSAKN
jgi:hypothetical protein